MSTLKVVRWQNDMIMVFDEHGQQVPEYQGPYEQVAERLRLIVPESEWERNVWDGKREHQYPEAWIQTFTGRSFFPLEPDPYDVSIIDIAHALSNICRYGGHCLKFFSVAEHSVLVASQAGIHGLLHDAAEAYMLDLPRPIKRELPRYSEIEDQVLLAIYEGLNVPLPTVDEMLAVKEADNRVLMTEKAVLHHDARKWSSTKYEAYPDMVIAGLPPPQARAAFMSAWNRLKPERMKAWA